MQKQDKQIEVSSIGCFATATSYVHFQYYWI